MLMYWKCKCRSL